MSKIVPMHEIMEVLLGDWPLMAAAIEKHSVL